VRANRRIFGADGVKKLKVCVVGLGYIGLPTAALLASNGHDVIGVDIDQNAVDTINAGRIHIVEPGLDIVVKNAVSAGRLHAYTTPQPADIFMICVPTPFHHDSEIPTPNIDYVLAATRSVAPFIRPGAMVILESTSPVGTTGQMAAELERLGVDLADVHLAYCPERVLPGRIMIELVENDRVVGGLTPEAARQVAGFYRSMVKGEVLETAAATAEMCKLTENSYRDVNIAFANELSILCSNAGIDPWDVIALANRHPRVNILQPGTGVGGHCIAVDPWFIVSSDPENARIIRTAREVNDYKTIWVIDQIAAASARFEQTNGRVPRIACLGLAFKPDIDDLRESPALAAYLALAKKGLLVAVEPNITAHDGVYLVTLDEAQESCDILALLVNHREFTDIGKSLDPQRTWFLDYCGANRSPHRKADDATVIPLRATKIAGRRAVMR
jgi:UDP-N-acetyl-D-mannosaminuronic acid dehydrogenase